MTRCLFVRPAASREAMGGDEVVYRKTSAFIAARMEVEILELEPVGRGRQLLSVLGGRPPETTRYLSAGNAGRLTERLAGHAFDAVVFNHEATFPLSAKVTDPKIRRVLYSHNTHSLVAATDPSRLGRLMRPLATAFERRWYGDPGARLVCISQGDVAGLRAAGVRRQDILVAPPGAPPSNPLAPGAGVIGEAILTGSYGWWRKRRDLKAFAEGPSLPLPVLATDPLALEILGSQGRATTDAAVDWSAGLRFGLITDRFQGGFKLKSTEYVAKNCVVISFCDLSAEFEGLPFAGEFVRGVKTKAQAAAVIAAMLKEPAPALVERFRQFQAACLERYGWDRCLAPLAEAIQGPA
jgi:hypothetical protein